MIENALAQSWGYSVQQIGVSDIQRAHQAFAALANHQMLVPRFQAIQARATHMEWQQSAASHEKEMEALIGEPRGARSLLYAATYGEERMDAEPR